MDKRHYKVICCICGKITAPRIPKGGDGTMLIPRRHNNNDEPCLGNFQEAEIIDLRQGLPVKKKMLLLENLHKQDIPKELIRIINSDWCKNQFQVEMWTQFQSAYWPENRKKTMERLFSADAFIASHVFANWCQLEIFIEVLSNFKQNGKRVDFYIMNPCLKEKFIKWLDQYEAYTTPDTKKYDDNPGLRKEFKKQMNARFKQVLNYHNVYELSKCLSDYREGVYPIKSKDLYNEE